MVFSNRLVGTLCMIGVTEGYLTPSIAKPQRDAPTAANAAAVAEMQAMQEPMLMEPPTSSWNPLALGMIAGLFAAFVTSSTPAAAADLDNGGGNTVAPDKKLKKDALQQYGKYEIPQVVAQVTKGNGAMPAFGDRLAPDDIGDVAAYVRAQADKGW